MKDKPDFRELVGDLPEEERARLERVHELLIAAGPPPELPPALVEPDLDPRDENVEFLPRRRAGLVLGIAAAVGVAAFLGGFLAGRAKEPFPKVFEVPMQGTAQAANASATIQVGKADEAGNWPLKVVVRGLKPLPKGQYYEMFLTKGTDKRAATCGTFRVIQSGDSVRLNAPYNFRRFDGWVVTLERPGSGKHPIVLTTKSV
jgi:hypothetical protein